LLFAIGLFERRLWQLVVLHNAPLFYSFLSFLEFLRTPSNGSLRPICLIRSSLQFDFILVYYKVTVLLRRCTFDCNWRTTSFYCIVLYCAVRYSVSKGREIKQSKLIKAAGMTTCSVHRARKHSHAVGLCCIAAELWKVAEKEKAPLLSRQKHLPSFDPSRPKIDGLMSCTFPGANLQTKA